MNEEEPTEWIEAIINQKRLDEVVSWHNENWNEGNHIKERYHRTV